MRIKITINWNNYPPKPRETQNQPQEIETIKVNNKYPEEFDKKNSELIIQESIQLKRSVWSIAQQPKQQKKGVDVPDYNTNIPHHLLQ